MINNFLKQLNENKESAILVIEESNREKVIEQLKEEFNENQFITFAEAEELVDYEIMMDKPIYPVYLMEVRGKIDTGIINLVIDTVSILKGKDTAIGLIIEKKYEELFKDILK